MVRRKVSLPQEDDERMAPTASMLSWFSPSTVLVNALASDGGFSPANAVNCDDWAEETVFNISSVCARWEEEEESAMPGKCNSFDADDDIDSRDKVDDVENVAAGHENIEDELVLPESAADGASAESMLALLLTVGIRSDAISFCVGALVVSSLFSVVDSV